MRVLPPTATLILGLLAPMSLAMASVAAPVAHANAPAAPPINAYRQLQALDAQLNRVAYRLTTANVPFCDAVQGSVGVVLHPAVLYPPEGRAAFGFTKPVQVLAIAPDSAAALSGVRVDDAVVGIDGVATTDALGGAPKRLGDHWNALFDSTQALLDRALAEGRASEWQIWRANGQSGAVQTVALTPVPACRARWQVLAKQKDKASSDGLFITISYDLMLLADEAGGDDAVAAVAAHELAHIMLGHRAYLDGLETKAKAARGGEARVARKALAGAQKRAERDADVLSQWLLANAGYASEPGMAFYTRIARRDFLHYSPKHGSWGDRIAAMRAEYAALMALPTDAMGRRAPPLLYGKGSYPW